MEIPKIKKKISSYVLGEEGKISKQSLLITGAFLGAAALSGILNAPSAKAWSDIIHSNDVLIEYNSRKDTAYGVHSHHGSHSSY